MVNDDIQKIVDRVNEKWSQEGSASSISTEQAVQDAASNLGLTDQSAIQGAIRQIQAQGGGSPSSADNSPSSSDSGENNDSSNDTSARPSGLKEGSLQSTSSSARAPDVTPSDNGPP